MGRLTYNGNRFTYVDKWDEQNLSYKGIQLATKLNQKNGQDYKLLDVIDIDFNRTWFAPTQSYITNAEEFFDAIETLDKTSDMSAINERIDEIVATYITRTEFESIISHYQGALNYGDHIAVVDNNTLIAYDVISNSQLYEFSTAYVSYSYLLDTTYNKQETANLIEAKITELIGGANEAFDTMQEISDWIMQQTMFVEVPYDEIDTSGDTRYYIYNTETGKYDIVSQEYIQSHPNEQYYKIESLASELKALDDKVGHVLFDPMSGYTYTGLLQDIHSLQLTDEQLENELDELQQTVNITFNTANTAVALADEARNISNEAKDLAYEAKAVAYSTIDKTEIAYAMAYSSYVAVGIPSHEAFYREITDADKAVMHDGDWAYEYSEEIGYYPSKYFAEYDYKQYYVIEPEVEATGLHKVAEDAINIANTSLFNLSIDNTNAFNSYVYLTIDPLTYENSPQRTIGLVATNTEYSIDEMKIYKDGLLTAYQFNDILSYVLGWEKLPSPSSN